MSLVERLDYPFELSAQVSALFGIPSPLTISITSATVAEHLRLCASDSPEFQRGTDATGLRVYSGAKVLCSLLLFLMDASPEFLAAFPENHVLELGCGCALSGIFAAHFASRVVLTDRESLSLAEANHRAAAARHPALEHRVEFCTLDWSVEALDRVLSQRARGFDLILASELVYFNTDPDLLVATIARCLSSSSSSSLAIMSHLNRLHDPTLLQAAIVKHGVSCIEVPLRLFLDEGRPDYYMLENIQVLLLSLQPMERFAERFSWLVSKISQLVSDETCPLFESFHDDVF